MDIFRQASKDEAGSVLALYREAMAKGRLDGTSDWDDDYPNAEVIGNDLAGRFLYVLEEEGAIAAAVSLYPASAHEGALDALPWTEYRACELSRLCVRPRLQGRGLGERMMRMASDRARQEGYEATRHFASVRNAAALRLYARMGYRKIGEASIYGGLYIGYELQL